MKKYKYSWPHITKETKKAIVSEIDKGEISIYDRSGIFEVFENKFSDYYGMKHALLFSSGTAAIHASMVACNFASNDEVICPAYTFFASVSPIFQTGAIPVLCDATPDGNIDPDKIEKLITSKTKAVVITHMWGIPCDIDKIVAICKKRKLLLIEDCSHAHGATYKGKLVGTFGDVAAFSLQGQKIITGGEGGIIVTNKREVYERALLFGHYNKRCKQEILPDSPYFDYAVTGFGLKLRAHPFAIAMADEQFSHLTKWHKIMNDNAKTFTNSLEGIKNAALPILDKSSEPSWYAYVIQLNLKNLDASAKDICKELLDAGVSGADTPGSTSPLNLLKLFQDPSLLYPNYKGKVSYKKGDFPIAENFYESAIKFPIDIYNTKSYGKTLQRYAMLIKNTLEKHSKQT